MRKLRVLEVVSCLHYGGMERLIAEMVVRLDHSRFDVHLLALDFLGHFSTGLERHATLHEAGPMSRFSMLRPTELAARIRAIAPDVVHTHGGIWSKSVRAARIAGVPFTVHTDHGRRRPDPWLFRAIDGLAARHTDVVVAVSEALADQMRRTVVARGTDLRVVVNGVDTALYAPRPEDSKCRQELGIPAQAPVIGSVGRLEPIKGYHVMIEAMRLLREHPPAGPAPVLITVGNGSERARIDELIARWELGDRVRVLGWRDDINRLHALFALFTMSSLSEGTSVSLLEAMSSGLCPVVTDVGGNAAVLGRGLAHRLVPASDPVALAGAWREALENGGKRAEDSARARARVQDSFSLETMVRKYERIYQRDRDAGQ